MQCDCGVPLSVQEAEEVDASTCLLSVSCGSCGRRFGVEGEASKVGLLLDRRCWTDEALHVLDRLPPYVAPLLRHDVEAYAQDTKTMLVTHGFLSEAKLQGTVQWSPETTRRLARVPPAVRAMARVELERTALDRGMAEVTVELMEEIKARYFGLGRSLA